MNAIVIDTNVLLVADGRAPQMSGTCRQECLRRLERARATEQIILDDKLLILNEYGHKLSPNGAPTAGNAFLKWLLLHQWGTEQVSVVTITPLDQEKTRFAEFPPDPALEAEFDPADRKFIAAANAHPQKPPVLECADSKWLGWEGRLAVHGIHLEVLCRCELQVIRKRKTR